MPIRVQCQCGHSINAPDNYAGKSGKCPKCAAVIKIPSSGQASTPDPSKQAPSKPDASSAKKAAARPQGTSAAKPQAPKPMAGKPAKMDDLFDQVGLVKRVGNFCPSCDAPIAAGTAICIKCGLNFETGTKLTEHASESSRQEFENKHLNEAAVMMRRDDALEARTRASGMPWWVLLCIILVAGMIVGAGVMLVDARQTGLQPPTTMMGKIQRLPIWVLAITILAINCLMISTFAHFAVVAQAFRTKPVHGWCSLLVPLYSPIFGLTQFKKIRGTVVAYWLAILIGVPALIVAAINLPSDLFS